MECTLRMNLSWWLLNRYQQDRDIALGCLCHSGNKTQQRTARASCKGHQCQTDTLLLADKINILTMTAHQLSRCTYRVDRESHPDMKYQGDNSGRSCSYERDMKDQP